MCQNGSEAAMYHHFVMIFLLRLIGWSTSSNYLWFSPPGSEVVVNVRCFIADQEKPEKPKSKKICSTRSKFFPRGNDEPKSNGHRISESFSCVGCRIDRGFDLIFAMYEVQNLWILPLFTLIIVELGTGSVLLPFFFTQSTTCCSMPEAKHNSIQEIPVTTTH